MMMMMKETKGDRFKYIYKRKEDNKRERKIMECRHRKEERNRQEMETNNLLSWKILLTN